jgi:hypothetical protein
MTYKSKPFISIKKILCPIIPGLRFGVKGMIILDGPVPGKFLPVALADILPKRKYGDN